MREPSHSGRTRRGGRALVLSAAGALALLAAGAEIDAAQAALPQQAGRADLVSDVQLRIDGAIGGGRTGAAVAGAGDVNGDGRGDVVVGAPQETARGRSGSGSAYVIFGTESPTRVDLAQVGARGFRIDGAADGDRLGTAVGGAGDVNGDGLADVVLGAPEADAHGRGGSGTAFVVFGRRETSAAVDLAALGGAGFRIDGAAALDNAGAAVAGAGDVNGDGRADLVVGAPRAGNNARPGSGSAHVVFGTGQAAAIDLAALGGAGFRIDGAAALDNAGAAVAGAGDVNGDGRADVVVGAPRAGNNARPGSGSAHVVFGRRETSEIDLAALGGAGFRIDGAAALDNAGAAVAGAGDVNGDGRADVVVGAPQAGNNARTGSGSAHVVFGTGQAAAIDLAALGGAGFRIDGAAALDNAGAAVAGAGDVNGDGRADVVVGAPQAGNNARTGSGSAHVVFGRRETSGIDLAALGGAGFRIDGAAALDNAGAAVAGAGDVNGDGRADVVVGAPQAGNNARPGSGSAHVLIGFGTPRVAYGELRRRRRRADGAPDPHGGAHRSGDVRRQPGAAGGPLARRGDRRDLRNADDGAAAARAHGHDDRPGRHGAERARHHGHPFGRPPVGRLWGRAAARAAVVHPEHGHAQRAAAAHQPAHRAGRGAPRERGPGMARRQGRRGRHLRPQPDRREVRARHRDRTGADGACQRCFPAALQGEEAAEVTGSPGRAERRSATGQPAHFTGGHAAREGPLKAPRPWADWRRHPARHDHPRRARPRAGDRRGDTGSEPSPAVPDCHSRPPRPKACAVRALGGAAPHQPAHRPSSPAAGDRPARRAAGRSHGGGLPQPHHHRRESRTGPHRLGRSPTGGSLERRCRPVVYEATR